jgi:Uma2 family endonuclease
MSITTTKPLPGTIDDPRYPDSDGQPMGETHFHVLAILHLFEALDHFFRNRADVYVAADMFLYYEQGNPAACKAPDVMVAKGAAGKHPRRSFRIWEEGVAPTVIFEVTSDRTRIEDDVVKPRVYAALGVSEYFVFDPDGDPLRPALAGFRLLDGVYQPLSLDSAGRLMSHELGLALVPESPLLRLIDVRTGRRLLTYSEQADEADARRRWKRNSRDFEQRKIAPNRRPDRPVGTVRSLRTARRPPRIPELRPSQAEKPAVHPASSRSAAATTG